MKRIAGGLALAAGLLASAPGAFAADAAGGKTEAERRLEEVLAELEAQRLEINGLKSQLAVVQGGSGIEAQVMKYLAADEAKKTDASKDDFRVFWKEGLNFQTADKAFHLKVGGRIMYDMVFPDADDDVEAKAGDFDALSGFRRLRVEFEGTIFKNVFYKNVIDFSDTGYAYKDNLIGFSGLPAVGNFQVGYFKEPVGLEELTSSKYITFTERSIATNAFVPAHNHGFQFFNNYQDGDITWAVGDFWDGGTGAARVEHGFSGRVTWVPFKNKDDGTLFHVGGSAQLRSPDAESDRFRARPETPFTPRTLDTKVISVDNETILGLEGAWVMGPFSVQGEYYRASIDGHPDVAGSPDPEFSGFYLAGSYFLTGESRPYKNGTFGRVKPKTTFEGETLGGAFEVALRYAKVDLDDDGVQGGVASDWTVGLNWYLNTNTRVMLDFVLHEVRWDSDTEGDVKSVVLRFQVDF
ncbi:MAG: hypothetical protein L6R43_01195 [Planctomycetes bacterium]|nr:hypothetical protein [Planctomycetota bacterium]